ncbi:MAG: endonuclease V, partial [Candidatus Omnitrophica bacterium]|nr:endonuclease V [Candidatus Omnitrophota bacterium]
SLMKDKDGTPLGAVLRSRDNTNPIFVSPGNLVDIPSSIKIILSCCPKYKLPEPIRAAHKAAAL